MSAKQADKILKNVQQEIKNARKNKSINQKTKKLIKKLGSSENMKKVFTTKSEPEKEGTIVEQVLNERNLTGFVKPEDIPAVAPVVFENQLGKVRIEGEVTPQKMALAKQFNDIFEQATGEIMDLAAYTPDLATLEFVKGQRLSQQKIDEIKNAPAWTIFNIGGENLMKTQDNKLENVKNYCYRLERAVIGQINVRKQEVARLEEILNLRDQELKDARADIKKMDTAFKKQLIAYQSQIRDLTENPLKRVGEMIGKPYQSIKDHEPTRNLFLKIKEVCVSFKNALLQLISK